MSENLIAQGVLSLTLETATVLIQREIYQRKLLATLVEQRIQRWVDGKMEILSQSLDVVAEDWEVVRLLARLGSHAENKDLTHITLTYPFNIDHPIVAVLLSEKEEDLKVYDTSVLTSAGEYTAVSTLSTYLAPATGQNVFSVPTA